jgi:hypothetical protein
MFCKSYVLKVTDVWKNDGRPAPPSRTNFWNMKFAQCLPWGRNGIACPRFWVRANQLGSLLMRSKLAISAVVVTSLFGSTLVASAQNQPAPGASGSGASSEGTVTPGATRGKKTQQPNGMTTGSSTRNGANKGGAANPSNHDDAGSGAGTMAPPPTSGSKY